MLTVLCDLGMFYSPSKANRPVQKGGPVLPTLSSLALGLSSVLPGNLVTEPSVQPSEEGTWRDFLAHKKYQEVATGDFWVKRLSWVDHLEP